MTFRANAKLIYHRDRDTYTSNGHFAYVPVNGSHEIPWHISTARFNIGARLHTCNVFIQIRSGSRNGYESTNGENDHAVWFSRSEKDDSGERLVQRDGTISKGRTPVTSTKMEDIFNLFPELIFNVQSFGNGRIKTIRSMLTLVTPAESWMASVP